jgi:hypothetical protein
MKKNIEYIYQKITQKNESVAQIIFALTQARGTSSSMLAHHIQGDITQSSKVKQIERTYRYGADYADFLTNVVFDIFKNKKTVISLDRTNWFLGATCINAFVAYINCENIGGICGIKMLDNNGGNTSGNDKRKMVENILKQKSAIEIECILGDREFCSADFITFLIECNVPFAIRLKENLKFVQKYLQRVPPKGKTLRNIAIKFNKEANMIADLSIKKLENEWLILISKRVKYPIKTYKKRWNIEVFFKAIKTAGFNIEKTKITNPSRLKLLFAMCSMAYLMCTMIGVYIDVHYQGVKRKKNGKSLILSFFRCGADWIKVQVHRHLRVYRTLATLVFRGL